MVNFKMQGGKKETVAMSQGLSVTAQRWELCDRGLLVQDDERRKTRKRPHSKPRKKTIKTGNRSEEE